MIKFNSKEHDIWFTSDTHYWHKNITYGESVWKNKETGCRKFNTTQEMSRHIVYQINKYVDKDAILFHLGDWSFGGINNIWNFRKQINCKNIYLVSGNHDHHIIKNAELPNVRRVEPYSQTLEDGKPISGEYPDYVLAQSLFKNVFTNQIVELEIDHYLFLLLHYPMQNWDDRHKQSIHLHGHTHGTLPLIPYRLDVGLDSAFNLFGEYKPFSFNDVITRINNTN